MTLEVDFPSCPLCGGAGHPGGVLDVSLPDRSSASWRIMDHHAANPYCHELEHHQNFTRERLAQLLADHGFVVEDVAIAYRYKAQLEMYARLAPASPT